MAGPRRSRLAARRRTIARCCACVVLALAALAARPTARGVGDARERARSRASVDPSLLEEWSRSRLPPKCSRALSGSVDAASGSWALSHVASRSKLYAAMDAELTERGLTAFDDAGGARTQGSGVDDLFAFDRVTGLARAKLTRLDVAVRAIVLPLPRRSRAAFRMRRATRAVVAAAGYHDGRDAWLQDPDAYHFSMFHASHHLAPTPASAAEVEAEMRAVARVVRGACAMTATIERVVATPSGSVVALWNLAGGSEPSAFRDALRAALPNAPAAQTVSDEHTMHTTLARLLRPPPGAGGDAAAATAAAAAIARQLTERLCGVEVTLPIAWFVQERDKLALALGGAHDATPTTFDACGGGG